MSAIGIEARSLFVDHGGGHHLDELPRLFGGGNNLTGANERRRACHSRGGASECDRLTWPAVRNRTGPGRAIRWCRRTWFRRRRWPSRRCYRPCLRRTLRNNFIGTHAIRRPITVGFKTSVRIKVMPFFFVLLALVLETNDSCRRPQWAGIKQRLCLSVDQHPRSRRSMCYLHRLQSASLLTERTLTYLQLWVMSSSPHIHSHMTYYTRTKDNGEKAWSIKEKQTHDIWTNLSLSSACCLNLNLVSFLSIATPFTAPHIHSKDPRRTVSRTWTTGLYCRRAHNNFNHRAISNHKTLHWSRSEEAIDFESQSWPSNEVLASSRQSYSNYFGISHLWYTGL